LGKPKVFFRTPTYYLGGSDSSSARQGGFNLIFKAVVLMLFRLLRTVWQVLMAAIMFLREAINRGFDYWLGFLSFIIRYAGKTHTRHISPAIP